MIHRLIVAPDVSRPCTACRHYLPPSYWSALLLGRQGTCEAIPVRGITLHPVTGRSTLGRPRECDVARGSPLNIYGGGECGAHGRYWEARDA
jgi:hypothetical protein